MGSRVSGIADLIEQVNHALMSFVLLIMRIAPLGIFCLVAARFGEAQQEGNLLDLIRQTGSYMSTVLIGLGIHAFVTLPVILWFFTRPQSLSIHLPDVTGVANGVFQRLVRPRRCLSRWSVQRSTRRSRDKSTEFVVPLGATINMDGTALYEAVAAIFIAQVAIGQGVVEPLTLTQQIIVAVTATLAAIGAAGIPEAGLVTMLIVLNAVDLPLEYMGLILSVDWLLDRFRTAV